jgi:anti-sigma-K factor RskA
MYDDDRDALAAEYVLGTLSADERDQAEALLVIDPGFAEIVRVWERRLGELNVMVEAVEPPAEVWEKIRTEIGSAGPRSAAVAETGLPAIVEAAPQTVPFTAPDIAAAMTPESAPVVQFELAPEPELELPPEPASDLAAQLPQDFDTPVPQDLDETSPVAALASSLLPPELEAPSETPLPPGPSSPMMPPQTKRSADIVDLERGVRRWRGTTVAMGAIAALLAVYIAVAQFAPGLIPLSRQPQPVVATRTQPPGARLVAVLQQDPTSPAFLLTVDPQNRTLTVRRVSATPEAGRSYELWLISSKYPSPRSLGLVGDEEFTARPLPANFDVDTVRAASYAISLEPAGGSSTGVPTGPVLFTGKLVESLPGSPS